MSPLRDLQTLLTALSVFLLHQLMSQIFFQCKRDKVDHKLATPGLDLCETQCGKVRPFHEKLFDETQVSHDKQQQEVLMPKASSTVTNDSFYLKSLQAELSACCSPSLWHTECQNKTWKHSLLILALNHSKVLNPLLTSFWFYHSTFCLAGRGRFITSF